MFAQIHFPKTLEPAELDRYLAKGWFRMGQTIFTTNFLNFNREFYSAVWLRVVLDQFHPDRTQQKLSKLNAAFRIEIQEATISPAQQVLYAIYRQGISFNASSSLNHLLYGDALENVYHTHEINIYDHDKLIATGFFDLGEKTAAGITSFYDPAYKKYSLGKYLILLKMEYCKKKNLRYFYPGYFVPGYPSFDYKLQLGKPAIEYLQLRSGQWVTVNGFSFAHSPWHVMQDKLHQLQALLTEAGISTRLFKYEFYNANLVPDLQGMELFDFPAFLYCIDLEGEPVKPIAVFDVRDHQFHVIKCQSIWASDQQGNIDGMFTSHLLKIQDDLLASERAEEVVSILSREVNRIDINTRISNL